MTCTSCGAEDKPIAWSTSGYGKEVTKALCLECLEKELKE